jgi:hypothetical protein
VDDVCRATINVISSGDEQDLQMLTPFVERLLTRYGDHVEILHRSYVPDDKPGLRLLEIWSVSQSATHSRNHSINCLPAWGGGKKGGWVDAKGRWVDMALID